MKTLFGIVAFATGLALAGPALPQPRRMLPRVLGLLSRRRAGRPGLVKFGGVDILK